MSTIAELIMEQGRIAAAARASKGQLWGRAIENISAIPRDVMQQKREQQSLDMQRQELNARLESQGQESMVRGQQIQAGQQAQEEKNALKQLWADKNIYNADHTINRQGLQQRAIDGGHPDLIPHLLEMADTLDASKNKLAEQVLGIQNTRAEALGRSALKIEAANYNPGLFHLAVTDNAITETLAHEQANQYLQINDPKQIKAITDGWKAGTKAGELKIGMVTEGTTPIDERTGKPLPGFTVTQKPKALQEQLLEAITAGDRDTADRITTTLRMEASAKRDPAATALANELGQLRAEEARARLEALRSPKEDIGISSDVRTTASGRRYVDLSKYKGKDYHAAQQQAHEQGVFGASSAETDALQNLDTARENMSLIEGHLNKLPSGAGSRLVSGPSNLVQAYFQTDPDLAAWGTWRTAAIQAMRALAGSKGLRINRSEIEASIENDIPKITDTAATAREKLARVQVMLDSQEHGLLGAAQSVSGATSPTEPPGTVEEWIRDATGKLVRKP